jgi:NTP pyrophosphatase (non-canonical NTP hydrolase)
MGMVIREYGRKLYGREYELSRNTLKLAEEAGEYVQAANRYMGYTVDRKFGSRGALAEELADVVICAFTCAATLDIDLGAAIDEKYREAVRLFSAELDTPQG